MGLFCTALLVASAATCQTPKTISREPYVPQRHAMRCTVRLSLSGARGICLNSHHKTIPPFLSFPQSQGHRRPQSRTVLMELLKEIFSRAERSCNPTWVTPMGQGLFPMASPM